MVKRSRGQPRPEQLEAQTTLRTRLQEQTSLRQRLEIVNDALRADGERRGLGRRSGLLRLHQLKARGDYPAFYAVSLLEFREYVRRRIEADGGVTFSATLIAGGQELLPVSSETCRRYLAELSSPHGPFVLFGPSVLLNAHYCPPEENPYWAEDTEPAELGSSTHEDSDAGSASTA